MTYKRFFFAFFTLIFCLINMPAFAEKIPVKIEPAQVISTHHDEVEVGDWINFEVVNDVYVDDNLYIKKGTKISGVVDFFHPNGWGGDSADIVFKKFYTTDVNHKKITIFYPLEIDGKTEMANSIRSVTNKGATSVAPRVIFRWFHFLKPPIINWQYLSYLGFVVRGSEISVEPDTTIYNIFIETESL